MTNLYDRHQNKKALAKKARAKTRSFGFSQKEFQDSTATWKDFKPKDVDISSYTKGIVSKVIKDKIKVLLNNEMIDCRLFREIPKTLRDNLIVGDKVYVNNENKIVYREDRKNHLSRLRGDNTRYLSGSKHTVAVNIDFAIIVATISQPKFNLGLIDRYLILCQYGNIKPIICLNKIDLSNERNPILSWYKEKLGIQVIEISAKENIGLDKLKKIIQHKIVVLVGNSGVGKSSIINKLLKSDDIKTQFISEKGRQGKHTTTSSDMYILDENTYIIDTPGIRALNLIGIKKENLQYYFREFYKFKPFCKYRDCLHISEPDCGIKEAVASGKINKLRYESYLRIISQID